MEKINTLMVASAVISISLLLSLDYHNAYAISISTHTVANNIQWAYGYTVGTQERIAVLMDAGATVDLAIYSVSESGSTVTYTLITTVTLSIISNVPNSTPPARIGNNIFFGGLNGATGYIVNFDIASNTVVEEQSIGANLYTYNLIAHNGALYGATEDLSSTAERVSVYDTSLNLLTSTNTPVAGTTVFVCKGDSNSIYTVDRVATNSRIREFSTISNTFVATLGSGNGIYTGCNSDGTYVYALRDTTEAIDRVTIASNTYTGSYATGFAFTTSNGNWITTNGDKLYVADDNGLKIVQGTTILTNTPTYRQQVTTNEGIIYTGSTTTTLARIVDDFTPPSSSGGIDCTLPENENLLGCRLGDNGVFGGAGNFVIGTAPTNTTDGTGIVGIGCGIGIVDCISDPDIKTNGLGILIFISSIFIVVGMFMTTQGAEKTFKIPTMIWAIIIIALSAFFTVTNIIDPVFLIVSIIGLIALASPRLVSMFGSGANSFGSGSTE